MDERAGTKVRRGGRDLLSPERRSWNMSRIRGKDTTPEKVVRSLLHRMGYRFRLHVRIPIAPSTNPHSFPFFREAKVFRVDVLQRRIQLPGKNATVSQLLKRKMETSAMAKTAVLVE